MRVGLDYLPAVTHYPGVGRYARELVRAMVRIEGAPVLSLLEAGGEARAIGEPSLGLTGGVNDVRRHRWRLPRRALAAACRLSGRGVDRWMGGLDLFHRIHTHWPPISAALQLQPVGELPPEGGAEDEATGRTLAGFDHLLAMSAHGAGELARRYGIESRRIHAVPIGSDQWRRALPEPPPRAGPPVVLVLGALQARRRHAAILAAFEDLVASGFDARLVFAGARGDVARDVEQRLAASPQCARAEFRPDAVEAEMPLTVASASALVHLTEGEESAVTLLEAFSFGTPVVATRLGAFAEAVGDAAELVDNDAATSDPAELGRAIRRAVESSRDEAACAAREAIAERHTWDANARATLDVWRRITAS